mgnify:CR=1 FL=1
MRQHPTEPEGAAPDAPADAGAWQGWPGAGVAGPACNLSVLCGSSSSAFGPPKRSTSMSAKQGCRPSLWAVPETKAVHSQTMSSSEGEGEAQASGALYGRLGEAQLGDATLLSPVPRYSGAKVGGSQGQGGGCVPQQGSDGAEGGVRMDHDASPAASGRGLRCL